MLDLIRAVFDTEYGIPFNTRFDDMDTASCNAVQAILDGKTWTECVCVDYQATAPEHWTCPECSDAGGWWSA